MRTRLVWFTSSYSDDQGGNCVEVATTRHRVHVRDDLKNARAQDSGSKRIPRDVTPGAKTAPRWVALALRGVRVR